MNTWIMVADAWGARLFVSSNGAGSLHLLERFSHAQSRAMEADLVSERSGSSRSSGHAMPSTKQPHKTHKELEAVAFATVLNDYLLEGARKHQFESLVLVAPPHFLGLLRAALDPALTRMISTTVAKDLIYMDDATIREHVIRDVWPVAQS